MVAIKHVRVLHGDAGAEAARVVGAGVIKRRHELKRIFVDHFDCGIDQRFGLARPQQHGRLLGRMLGQQLKILRQLLGVRRRAGLQPRETVAHVRVVEILVAFDHDLADLRFDYAQADHAAGDVLLGQQNLDDAVAAVAVDLLERLQSALNIGKILLLADVGSHRSIDFTLLEQRVARYVEALDVEARRRHDIGLRCLRPYRSRIRSHAYVRQKSKAAFDDFFHPAAFVMLLYRQPYQKNTHIINNFKRVSDNAPQLRVHGYNRRVVPGASRSLPAPLLSGRFPPRNLRF